MSIQNKKIKKDIYKDIFHNAGIKYTDVRKSVYKIIEKSKNPISSLDIMVKLEKEYYLNKTTLYRNIEALKDAGLIETYTYGHTHIHCEISKKTKKIKTQDCIAIKYKLICNKCDTFEDIDLKTDPKRLLRILNKNSNFKKVNIYNKVRIEVFCDCDKCII